MAVGLGAAWEPGEQRFCLCRCVAMMVDGLSPSNITNFYLAGCKVRRARTGQVAPGARRGRPDSGSRTRPRSDTHPPEVTNWRRQCFLSPSEQFRKAVLFRKGHFNTPRVEKLLFWCGGRG